MADRTFDDLVPPRSEAVHRRHRLEVLWQITVPFALGVMLLLAVCGLVVYSAAGGGASGHWRDMSLVWMLAPTLVLALVPLLLFAALAYGVIRVIALLPPIFYRVQRFMGALSSRSLRISDRVASPVIRVRGVGAALRKLRS